MLLLVPFMVHVRRMAVSYTHLEEERYADLSQVDDNRYEQLIKDTDSDYVLFLNQHYLKWQRCV